MAHNIYDNRMFCVGKAWHDVGVRVDKEVNSAEAIKLARLDYEVKKVTLYANIDGKMIDSEVYGTLNASNNKVLGTVTDRYKIVQNVDAFSFFDDVVKNGEAFYHSAGALGNGERIWLLAKLPKSMLIFKDIDVVDKYLILVNNHDGKGSLYMYFTPIRVVCQNTLNASWHNKENMISIKHVGDIKGKVERAREAMGFALDFYTEFEDNAKKMVNKTLTKDEAEKYFDRVLEIKEDDTDLSTQIENTRDRLKSLYVNGTGNNIDGVKNTLWAGYNAVTEYADYHKTTRGDRVNSILFGSGAVMKRKAYDEACLMVK